MKRILTILFLFSLIPSVYSTHNRAGEITYAVDANNPLKFHVTVTTYTDPASVAADRCEITINWGDGEQDTIYRINDGPGTTCSCPNGNCGEQLNQTVKMNKYKGVHIYDGASTYTISVDDPNRNDGILNIPNSVNTTFYITSTLVIDNWTGANSSPILTFPPIDNGCTFEIFQHNPGAIDPDGDSLVYSLVPCRAPPPDQDGLLDGYSYPNQVPGNLGTSLTVDANTGLVEWDSPQIQGEFNFCILIEEFDKSTGTFKGSVLRDMQVTIAPCQNEPPELDVPTPLCITAGTFIDTTITATDPDNDFLTLTSTGSPYLLANSPASFDTVSGFSPITSNFSWLTECSHVKKDPYQVHFRVEDQTSGTSIVRYETMEIQVVAPPPTNLTATPQGSSIILDWDATLCTNALGYKIYRKIDSLGWCPSDCELGVPAYTGYTQIGTVSGSSTTTYTDNDGGAGLLPGYQYCYIVVAYFSDGAESYATCEACASLKRDIPVITHVTINSTSATGSDSIIWSFPIELDTINILGPYYYEVRDDANNLIWQSPANNSLSQIDTFYVHTTNTTVQKYYRVDFYAGGGSVFMGSTQQASSVFLAATPSDNKITLTWTENVPWTNNSYIVMRFNNQTTQFDTLDTVTVQSYVDSSLTNSVEYCYYVTSVGAYSGSGFTDPIYNRSQEVCDIPIDNVAPCSPISPNISSNCEELQNDLTWTNPNNICADDVVGYIIYYSPLLGQELLAVDTILDANTTSFDQTLTGSVAGCYAVTAIDTFYNESPYSDMLCVDNCPIYELPAVFSPGTDGVNDLFVPFPYMFIESIDIQIYNRWGNLVYTETNPDILWDGTSQMTGAFCPSGVYYYICQVNEYRLTGIESRTLTGYIHLIREDGQ